MGLFAKIKELFSAQKYIFGVMAEMDRKNAAYASMTLPELEQLSDDDLISALLYRTDKKLIDLLGKKKKSKPAELADLLTGAQRTAYILSHFEFDMQTGGLSHFLKCNGALASVVSECLGNIGATEYRALYDEFFSTYGINLRQTALVEYSEEIALFDQSYSQLPPMEPILAPYLRANLSEF